MPGERRRSDRGGSPLGRRTGWVAVAGGASVIAYWSAFLAGAIESAPPGGVVHAFELAFPGADALLAAAALWGGTALIRGERIGGFLIVVAGAMSLYLGVLDVTFYGRHGFYWPPTGQGALELLLNLFCIGGGGLGLVVGWKLWDAPRVRALPGHGTRSGPQVETGREIGESRSRPPRRFLEAG